VLIEHYRRLGKIHAKANALKQAIEDLAHESEDPEISELVDAQGDIVTRSVRSCFDVQRIMTSEQRVQRL
jgi:hypothetical protein